MAKNEIVSGAGFQQEKNAEIAKKNLVSCTFLLTIPKFLVQKAIIKMGKNLAGRWRTVRFSRGSWLFFSFFLSLILAVNFLFVFFSVADLEIYFYFLRLFFLPIFSLDWQDLVMTDFWPDWCGPNSLHGFLIFWKKY